MTVKFNENRVSSTGNTICTDEGIDFHDLTEGNFPENFNKDEYFKRDKLNSDNSILDLSLEREAFGKVIREFYCDKTDEEIRAIQKWAKKSNLVNRVLDDKNNKYIASLLLNKQFNEAADEILSVLDNFSEKEQSDYLDSYSLATTMLNIEPALITASETDFLFRGQGEIKKISRDKSFKGLDISTRFLSTSYCSESVELYRGCGDVFAIQISKERPVKGIPVPNKLKNIGITKEIAKNRGLEYHDDVSNIGNYRSVNNEIILTPMQGFSISERSISIKGRNYRPVIVGMEQVKKSMWRDVEGSLRAKLYGF